MMVDQNKLFLGRGHWSSLIPAWYRGGRVEGCLLRPGEGEALSSPHAPFCGAWGWGCGVFPVVFGWSWVVIV